MKFFLPLGTSRRTRWSGSGRRSTPRCAGIWPRRVRVVSCSRRWAPTCGAPRTSCATGSARGRQWRTDAFAL